MRKPRAIRVGRRAYLWLLAGLLPAMAAAPQEAVRGTLAINGLLVLLFVVDALRLRSARLEVRRQLPDRMRVGSGAVHRLYVKNLGTLWLRVRVRDELPELLHRTREADDFLLKPQGEQELTMNVTPLGRGSAMCEPSALSVESRLGLASLHFQACERQAIRVLPGRALATEAKRGRRQELGGVAQRVLRSTQGSELESLREYVSQDPLRSIDWKATARRHRPVTRLFQPERSQTVWLVLDASRTMAQSVGAQRATAQLSPSIEKSRFDIAVEAALSLAETALYAGDRVGLLVYADGCVELVPPGRGKQHALRLVDVLSDVEARPVHLAVRSLLLDLERHARRRSLIALFTDLENETHGEAVCEHAPLLTRRHLAVCISLEDALLKDQAKSSPRSDEQVFHKAAAIDLLTDRQRLERRLERRGIPVLGADIRGLAPKLLDHYLKVKLTARL